MNDPSEQKAYKRYKLHATTSKETFYVDKWNTFFRRLKYLVPVEKCLSHFMTYKFCNYGRWPYLLTVF